MQYLWVLYFVEFVSLTASKVKDCELIMRVGVANKPLASCPSSVRCAKRRQAKKHKQRTEFTDMDRVSQDPGHSHVYVNM